MVDIGTSNSTVDLDDLSTDAGPDEGDDEPFRIGEIHMETNNATHIQQFCLALIDAGFETRTEWQEDGAWVTVLWDSDVVEG